ncbi:MAG: hypothetical protein V3W18_05700 [candidate division Zixibacteria bacterium]
MPRRSRKTMKSGRGRLILLIPTLVLLLSLAWIWKANKVKDYYSEMKKLEKDKKALDYDNSRLKTGLAELKSLMVVDKTVSRRLGLTQKVSGRIFLEDPVKSSGAETKFDFVDMDDVTDWLEGEVLRSGKVNAKESGEDKK